MTHRRRSVFGGMRAETTDLQKAWIPQSGFKIQELSFVGNPTL